MRPLVAVLQLLGIIIVTSVAEFTSVRWAGWLALALTVLLALHWIRAGKQRWLLYAVIILTLFPEAQSTVMVGLELHHILAAVLAISVFASWAVLRPWPLPRLSRLLITYYVAIGGLTLIQYEQLKSTHRLFVIGLFILVALLVPFVIRTKRHLFEFFGVLVAANLVSVAIGLGAYYFANVSQSLFTNPYIHISTVEGVPRLAGTLLDSNFLGHQLILVLPGLLILAPLVTKLSSVNRKASIALYATTLLLLAALWLTYSRSSYVGLGVALVVLLFGFKTRLWKSIVAILVASLALATLLIPSFPFFSVYRFPSTVLPQQTKEQLLLGFNPRALVDRYIAQVQSDPNLSEEEREQILARDVSSESLGYRIEFWKAGLAMFTDHPFIGVGVGQFRYRFSEYSDLEFIREPDAHNIFVEQLAETGVVGTAGLLSVLGYALYVLGKRIRANKDRVLAVVVLAVLLGLLTQSLLLGGLGVLPLYITLGVISVWSEQSPFIRLGRPLSRGTRSPNGNGKKRVVYITATTQKDGPGNVLFYQLSGMDRARLEPIVITVLGRGEWDTEYKRRGIKRINIGLPKPLDIITPFILWPILYWLRPDLVQTQMIRGDVYGRWAAMRCAIPFISVVHNMDVWKHSRRRFHRFATWFDAHGLAQAEHIVAVSQAVKDDLHRRQGIDHKKISVIRNAIDAARFTAVPRKDKLEHLKKRLTIPLGAPVVLTVARAHQQKAPEIWITAALAVLKKLPSTRFVWAGAGPLLSTMRDMIPPEYAKNILLIGQRRDVPDLLHICDVFVLPSRFEGLPTVLIEAMAAGKACVATKVSGNPELVEHSRRGLLVPPNRPQELARAIRTLLGDKELRAKLGQQAQRFILQEFTAERLAQEYQNLTIKLVGQ